MKNYEAKKDSDHLNLVNSTILRKTEGMNSFSDKFRWKEWYLKNYYKHILTINYSY